LIINPKFDPTCWNPEGWPGFEIGWALRREYWDRGYATEGAHAAIDFAFAEFKQDRIISLIQPANAASIKVVERIGEKLIEHTEAMGKECMKYRMSRNEWSC
jgi:RimJ/RimL family protein N-acetyltransferase